MLKVSIKFSEKKKKKKKEKKKEKTRKRKEKEKAYYVVCVLKKCNKDKINRYFERALSVS